MISKQQYDFAKRIQDECIQTALSAYESASISGLCGEGAFEAAISAMRMMDVGEIVSRAGPAGADGR